MDLSLFNFEGSGVRVIIDKEGAPWFVGRDVCRALGYANPRDAISKHLLPKHKDAVAICDATGRNQQTTIISKPAVFRLAMRSKAPGAEAFQEWVEEEVLPAIFNDGAYTMKRSAAEVARQKEVIRLEAKQVSIPYAIAKLIRKIPSGNYCPFKVGEAMARLEKAGHSRRAVEFCFFESYGNLDDQVLLGNSKLLEAS